MYILAHSLDVFIEKRSGENFIHICTYYIFSPPSILQADGPQLCCLLLWLILLHPFIDFLVFLAVYIYFPFILISFTPLTSIHLFHNFLDSHLCKHIILNPLLPLKLFIFPFTNIRFNFKNISKRNRRIYRRSIRKIIAEGTDHKLCSKY